MKPFPTCFPLLHDGIVIRGRSQYLIVSLNRKKISGTLFPDAKRENKWINLFRIYIVRHIYSSFRANVCFQIFLFQFRIDGCVQVRNLIFDQMIIFIFFFLFLRKFIFIEILRKITPIVAKKVHNMSVYMHID